MTSFIISSEKKDKRDTYITELCKEHLIDSFDITTLSLEVEEKGKKTTVKQSIGIEEIKEFQKKVFFKPRKSPEKAIVISDADKLTTEAQNAMLKLLEEPPDQTIIILSTQSVESLLPTIKSRCTIIELEKESIVISEKDAEEIGELVEILKHMSISDALMLAEKASKSKPDALELLERLIRALREEYLNNPGQENSVSKIKKLQEVHTQIKTTNINVRMCLEAVFLSCIK